MKYTLKRTQTYSHRKIERSKNVYQQQRYEATTRKVYWELANDFQIHCRAVILCVVPLVRTVSFTTADLKISQRRLPYGSALQVCRILFGFYYEFEPRSLCYYNYRHHSDIASQMHHQTGPVYCRNDSSTLSLSSANKIMLYTHFGRIFSAWFVVYE